LDKFPKKSKHCGINKVSWADRQRRLCGTHRELYAHGHQYVSDCRKAQTDEEGSYDDDLRREDEGLFMITWSCLCAGYGTYPDQDIQHTGLDQETQYFTCQCGSIAIDIIAYQRLAVFPLARTYVYVIKV
jgi:hypothetical protein